MDSQGIKKVTHLFTNSVKNFIVSLGMLTENQDRLDKGKSIAYSEKEFFKLLKETQSDHNSLNNQLINEESNKVTIHFQVDELKAEYIFKALEELSKAGIEFPTSGLIKDNFLEYDWEFDGSVNHKIKVYIGGKD